MRSMTLLRHICILVVFAMLSGAAAPAFADDQSGSGSKDKKAATSHQKAKSQKSKPNSAVSKETPPAYPNLGAPTGY
jgi:hypothetical protein